MRPNCYSQVHFWSRKPGPRDAHHGDRVTCATRLRCSHAARPATCSRKRADMGVDVAVTNLTKQFGKQLIWKGVSLTLPAGEISVMLGPSGTGKSVFLKAL